MKRSFLIVTIAGAIALAMVVFTGCTVYAMQERHQVWPLPVEQANASATMRIVDTETLRIEREGQKTRVYDLAGGAEYAFVTHRVIRAQPSTLAQKQARCIARTAANSSTIKIELAGNILIVRDLTERQTYYIDCGD